jgi:hypothetical protein
METEIEGFFNLVFAHFVTLFDLESPDTRTRLDKLLNTVASSTTDPSTKYRMCVLKSCFTAFADLLSAALVTSSMLYQGDLRFVFPPTKASFRWQAQTTSLSLWGLPQRLWTNGWLNGLSLPRRRVHSCLLLKLLSPKQKTCEYSLAHLNHPLTIAQRYCLRVYPGICAVTPVRFFGCPDCGCKGNCYCTPTPCPVQL